MHNVGLFWFTNDLRVDDNAALIRAASEVDTLICLVCLDNRNGSPGLHLPGKLSPARQQFLLESLLDLDRELQKLGQHLVVRQQQPLDAIAELITVHNVSHLFSSTHVGNYEKRIWNTLQTRYAMLNFTQLHSHRLFQPAQLPFAINDLPDSFSKFRRLIEKSNIEIPAPQDKPLSLPKPCTAVDNHWQQNSLHTDSPALFVGGASAGERHIKQYFSRNLASSYKQTRNGLDGMDYSTKFSPWLANGSVSVRRVVQQLQQYEAREGANDSTYWILFELLWREYFQCYADKFGSALFRFSGIGERAPTTSFYAERFRKWCTGNTPYPLINGFMHQLNRTGYLSNRGRQLVASCFVHELNLDWRHGASYFEQQLIDYDVASNWGNWQYLAGVGADPRGHRRFDLQKQAQIYDPDKQFVKRWAGDQPLQPLDSVDAADWPL